MARKTYTKKKYPFYKKPTNSLVKRAKGNFSAAKKQNDVADFVINFTHTFPVTSYTDSGNVNYSGYVMNIWDLLSKAPNFKAFKSLYDQVRINGVQVKLQISNATVNVNTSNTIYNVYTAWDTNGIDQKFMAPTTTTNGDGTYNIVGIRTNVNEAIATFGSTSKMQLNPFQRWAQNRSIYPSSMAEKSQFVSTDSISEWHGPFNNDTKSFELTSDYKALFTNLSVNEVRSTLLKELDNIDNPCILQSNSKYAFKPTLYINAFSSDVND